jgi:anti-sigma factor RsiW
LSGIDSLPEARKAAVEAFLRAHPELPVLVAKVG